MTTSVSKKNNIVFTAILKCFYEKKSLRCIGTWKENFECKCGKETNIFRKLVNTNNKFEKKDIYLCSDNLCKSGNQYGIDKINNVSYIFWYDNEKYLFTYIKLPHFFDIENKNKKDARNEWNRIYNLYIEERKQITKQSEELTLKLAQKHIEDKKIEQCDMEEIFSFSLIKEKLDKNIMELEKGKTININFNIQTIKCDIKLCTEYISDYKDFKFDSCVILPISRNIEYNHTSIEDNNFKEEKIMLDVLVPKLEIGKQ